MFKTFLVLDKTNNFVFDINKGSVICFLRILNCNECLYKEADALLLKESILSLTIQIHNIWIKFKHFTQIILNKIISIIQKRITLF